MAKPNRPIPGVDTAKSIYGVRHFRFPIDVVNHENRLGVDPQARMTCGQCKKFETQDHIVDHHANRAGQGELF